MSDKKRADLLEKISSGIEGFDDITAGGLPLRRTTLLMGGRLRLDGHPQCNGISHAWRAGSRCAELQRLLPLKSFISHAMKTFLVLLLGFCLAASTQAQAPAAPAAAPLLTPDQLDQLLGPIALYPDSLIALILPAQDSLTDGHRGERSISCYADALYICHGFAVDQAASTGKITHFNISSTVVKARKLLARDGLSRRARVEKWYREHPQDEPGVIGYSIDPEELARVHAQAVASFPR